MRILFFGTPDFAAEILSDLVVHGFNIVGIVTQPDRPQGRSGTPQPPLVKQIAQKLLPSSPCLQPERVSSPESIAAIAALRADLFVVVSYGQLLKQSVLDLPPYGAINVHPSLLPAYRGPAPIQRCLMDGPDETGVTIMRLVLAMDAGPILKQERCPIPLRTNYLELRERLCEISRVLLREVIEEIAAGTAQETPQEESKVTFAPKITLEDTQIDWHRSALTLHNLVRASAPEPGAWCRISLKGVPKTLRILKTLPTDDVNDTGKPGQILQWDRRAILVACSEGVLQLLQLQLEGKNVVPAADFAMGYSADQFELVSSI